MRDFTDDLKALRARVDEAHRYLRVDDATVRFAQLESEMQRPDLWEDQARAKDINAAYAAVRDDLAAYQRLAGQMEDVEVLHELARDEGDDSQEQEIAASVEAIDRQLAELELRSLFTGEHDEADAMSGSTPRTAAWTPRTGPRCCCGCTPAGPSGGASR